MSKIPLFKVTMSPDAGPAVTKVLDSGYIGQGQKVEEFETKFQEVIGSSVKPLTTNSCTAALILALKTLEIGPDSVVATSPMTCTATNQAIMQTGAKILWYDVDPYTGLIDVPKLAKCMAQHRVRFDVLMTVDWGGTLCDYKAIKDLQDLFGNKFVTVQDAAHCIKIGPDHGDYVAWSFGPIKHLTMTDGGALLTPDCQLEYFSSIKKEATHISAYDKAKLLRWFGIDRNTGDSFRCQNLIEFPGAKFHANDVQAQVGLCNMSLALEGVEKARANAAYYNSQLSGIDGLILPPFKPSNQWWLYSIVVPGQRDKLINYLDTKGIMASPVHARNDLHPVFRYANPMGPLAGLEFFASNQLSIPVGWWVTKNDREYIVQTIKEFFKRE